MTPDAPRPDLDDAERRAGRAARDLIQQAKGFVLNGREQIEVAQWAIVELDRLYAIEQRARDAAKAGATEHGDGAVAYTALLILGEV